ncbi:MAG: metallophosphoesterase [Neisseria sp.]|uniref:metallophosphoesterase n=1 Tax=Neisseria sp. TaxID=192066 RepID=UPI0026DAD2A8|nr:metallophosphoesterase [Neisseria sp.]MDO4642024.1 metallophosphoesterase [Neisseria sp.]
MFFAFIFIIIQALTFCFAKCGQWFFKTPKGSAKHRLLLIGTFVFSNGILVLTMLRHWHVMFRISAGWILIMLFTLFAAIAVALLWLALKKSVAKPKLDIWLRAFGALFLCGIIACAIYNAYTPVIRHLSITIDKPLDKPLRIGMASDLHLGYLFRNRQLDELAAIMDKEKVDIILLPGDIMDDDTDAYQALHMQPDLMKLRAPLGVYATMGNHDLLGHERDIHQALTSAGIKVLSDDVIKIDNRFWLIGRPDDNMRSRQSTESLLLKADANQPVFLLDHRPSEIEKHAKLPIDLQVSGHVHNGQVFPANIIVKFLNRLAYGYEKIGMGHYVVTSGYGFWGIPFRLGSQSEVWIIDVKSDKP